VTSVSELLKWSFLYSAVLHFWPIFKNVSKRRNYKIMGVDTNADTDTAE
jgi:cytochrome c oxidase assembly factor CtaG